jgi:shikimate dehydrogenase
MKYGLIGFPLGHSLSPLIHGEIFKRTGLAAEYSLFEIAPGELSGKHDFLSSLDGFNVTIPHKESVIAYCDKLDPGAECGAVNCVKNKIGYNTDVCGFMKSVEALGASLSSRILLLGYGGAGKMVAHCIKQAGGELTVATRQNIIDIAGEYDLLINSTPVGMYPNTDASPIDFGKLSAEYVLDLIYNPAETKLLALARASGAKTMNGMMMLVWQAIKSHEIWYGGKVSDTAAAEIIRAVELTAFGKPQSKPIYLYGFMGCGKSHYGRKLAREAALRHIDLDERIGNVAEIFAKHGEAHFRALELNALRSAEADIISLGGGALKSAEAAAFARANAVVVFIDTPFETCYERIKGDKSRPLAASKTKDELFTLYESRLLHYREVADYTIKGEDEWLSIMQELRP